MKKTILCLLIFWAYTAHSQQKFTISGHVKDKKNGEALLSALIYNASTNSVLAKSNEYGFYSITLPQGTYQIKAKQLGYKESIVDVILDSNRRLTIELESNTTLKEAVIRATKKDNHLKKAVMGTEVVNLKETAKIPVIFGEKDILKTLQLTPGVKPAGEGSSGFHVRGGSVDQNLILLDEATVYNASHALGFFSTFNNDALKDVTLIKGSSPANYGGRLSSVLDVRMKEGNNKKFTMTGGIGLISSRLTAEIPIVKDKASLMISGRRTYVDLFLKATEEFKNNELYFYDMNLKGSYKLGEKNKIFLSGYFGRDEMSLGENFGFDWGNANGTIRWNHQFSNKMFSNTSFIVSNYDYNVNIKDIVNNSKIRINSSIADINFKQDFQVFVTPDFNFRFGVSAIHHRFKPITFKSDSINFNKKTKPSLENAAYVNSNIQLSNAWSMDLGIRASAFTIIGGEVQNIYDNTKIIDSVDLRNKDFGKTYINLEPRVMFNYMINDQSSLKFGYARNAQYVHLINNSAFSNPTEFWVASSYNVKPQTSEQWSIGYMRSFGEDAYEVNVESYYKNMHSQIDFRNSADIYTSDNVESELLYGKGRAYGLELSIKKKIGRLTGWIAYTLSKTERQIDQINNNQWYSAKQDRTHDISIVGIFQLSKRWSLSSTFVYNTGDAVTFPSGKYTSGGVTQYIYNGRNNDRMPDYHRLDFSATLEGKENKKFQSSWNFGLYNVYGRENAYIINFTEDKDNPNKTKFTQTALFRWIPSVTYNFKF